MRVDPDPAPDIRRVEGYHPLSEDAERSAAPFTIAIATPFRGPAGRVHGAGRR